MKRISYVLGMAEQYQELFYNGQQLNPRFTLQRLGIKDDDEIILKHSMLSVWKAYLYLVESVEDAVDYRKPGIAKRAIEHKYRLLKGDFLVFYPEFIPIDKDTHKVIAHFEDLCDTKIIDSAKLFFAIMYSKNPENPEMELEFRQKTSKGMQGGMICDIKREGEIITFFLKVHAARSSRSIGPVDICELFVYRLLHYIKIGPEFHFIPNVPSSSFGLYIATREVHSFKKPKRLQVGVEQMTLLHLLRSIFYLTDLHSDNFGLDKDDHLVIIDFQIDDISSRSDEIWKKYMSEDKNERYRIGKEALTSFCLAKKIEEADSSLEETKKMLHNRCINCHWSKYSKYLEQVKSNIQFFGSKFADS